MLYRFFYIQVTVLFFVLNSLPAEAQSQQNDFQLLKAKEFEAHVYHRHVTFGFKKDDKWYKKYNPANLMFGAAMFTYQRAISPQLGSGCMYRPSCSAYSKNLIKEYGLVKGVFTSSDRLLRCNRISGTSIKNYQVDRKTGRIHESVDYYRYR